MILDGKAIAKELEKKLTKRLTAREQLKLLTVVTQHDFVTQKYITIKQEAAKRVGVKLEVQELNTFGTSEDLVRMIFHAGRDFDGIIVQLPLAHHIEESSIRKMIPITHDVDVYGDTAFSQLEEGRLPILPPVVGAMSDILHGQGISLAGKETLIIGEGRLVGRPAKVWAERMGAQVQVVNKETIDIYNYTSKADVIIAGAGAPGLVRPDMVKDGVIILDAGTSEAEGKMHGDVVPEVAEKASLFTPVPGGIGPIAIVKIFENLLILKERREAVGM